MQICRVEDILVQGLVEGSVIHFHRARTITVQSSGVISTSGMGMTPNLFRAALGYAFLSFSKYFLIGNLSHSLNLLKCG